MSFDLHKNATSMGYTMCMSIAMAMAMSMAMSMAMAMPWPGCRAFALKEITK